jgi:hypothetical protein
MPAMPVLEGKVHTIALVFRWHRRSIGEQKAKVIHSPFSLNASAYSPNKAYCYSHLPLVWGTHICFTIELD